MIHARNSSACPSKRVCINRPSRPPQRLHLLTSMYSGVLMLIPKSVLWPSNRPNPRPGPPGLQPLAAVENQAVAVTRAMLLTHATVRPCRKAQERENEWNENGG
jgi:hypothetical protein